MCDLQYSWYEKQQLRAKIQVQVQEFLSKGGVIQKFKILKRGVKCPVRMDFSNKGA